MNQIAQNLAEINQRVVQACKNSQRNPSSVKVLLATKTVSAENIKQAINAGAFLIGENKMQELKEKHPLLKSLPHETHFIGHLQTNKVKDLLKYEVACLHSLDRWELAEKLHQRLLLENKRMNVLIQVNTSEEPSKFGIPPAEALSLVRRIATLSTLQIKGLMTIGLFSGEEEKIRLCFQVLKKLQRQVALENIEGVEMQELSMGMSGDLEIAIEEGATIIRIGTAVFGVRNHPDSYYWNELKAKP